MGNRELTTTLRLITKVMSNSRVGQGQRDRLQKAKRELEAVARSGRINEERVFRAAKIVATVLLELVEETAKP